MTDRHGSCTSRYASAYRAKFRARATGPFSFPEADGQGFGRTVDWLGAGASSGRSKPQWGGRSAGAMTAEAMKDSGWVASGLVLVDAVARGKASSRVGSPASFVALLRSACSPNYPEIPGRSMSRFQGSLSGMLDGSARGAGHDNPIPRSRRLQTAHPIRPMGQHILRRQHRYPVSVDRRWRGREVHRMGAVTLETRMLKRGALLVPPQS